MSASYVSTKETATCAGAVPMDTSLPINVAMSLPVRPRRAVPTGQRLCCNRSFNWECAVVPHGMQPSRLIRGEDGSSRSSAPSWVSQTLLSGCPLQDAGAWAPGVTGNLEIYTRNINRYLRSVSCPPDVIHVNKHVISVLQAADSKY